MHCMALKQGMGSAERKASIAGCLDLSLFLLFPLPSIENALFPAFYEPNISLASS